VAAGEDEAETFVRYAAVFFVGELLGHVPLLVGAVGAGGC
jgi:hypothetical protein